MTEKNMVNHPAHYNSQEIETFEMFLLRYHDKPDYIKGALLFNIDKYRDRSSHKGKEEDIEKLHWYLDKFEMFFSDDIKNVYFYRDYVKFQKLNKGK